MKYDVDRSLTENAFNHLSNMLADKANDLGARITMAEESFIVGIIALEGYSPEPSADAEWTKHITMHDGGMGLKIVQVDGIPKYRIITEAPAPSWNTDQAMDLRYTVRVERIPPWASK